MGDDINSVTLIPKIGTILLVPGLWSLYVPFTFSMIKQIELFPYEESIPYGIFFVIFFIVSSICNAIVYSIYYFLDKIVKLRYFR